MSAVTLINKKDEIPDNHSGVVLRNLGYQLLRTAKDYTIRVLPVQKITQNTYQISCHNNFSFISKTLINLVRKIRWLSFACPVTMAVIRLI